MDPSFKLWAEVRLRGSDVRGLSLSKSGLGYSSWHSWCTDWRSATGQLCSHLVGAVFIIKSTFLLLLSVPAGNNRCIESGTGWDTSSDRSRGPTERFDI